MKRFTLVLLVACIILFAAGCGNGGITEKDFVVNVGGETLELGMPNVYKGEEVSQLGIDGGELMKMGVLAVNVDDLFEWITINREGASLGCGLKVGDNASEVIKVLGKNIIYDENQSESEYIIKYYYYVKNGKFYGIADQFNVSRLFLRQMNEEEEKNYEKIKDDLKYYDANFIHFVIIYYHFFINHLYDMIFIKN